MALSNDEQRVFGRLSGQLTRDEPKLRRLDNYLEGSRRLEQLGLAIPPALERFVTIVNWPRVTAEEVERRCDVEGFRVAEPRRPRDQDPDASPEPDQVSPPADGGSDLDGLGGDLWDIWQANDMDEESQLGILDSVALGRGYVCTGSRDPKDPSVDIDSSVPLMTIESPFDMTHEADTRTRRPTAALRRTERDDTGRRWATLYLLNATIWLEHQGRRGWVEQGRDEHNIGALGVEPLLNKPRTRGARNGTGGRMGTSEIADVISLTDAACRALTDAQVATEIMAIPQRHAAGVSQGDFVDKDGKTLPVWETYFGAVWATANKDAKFGQFSAADLKNFETIVWLYANLCSGVSGLPSRFYGQMTSNPPSEGSIIADETRLIMNARRKHRVLGGSFERSMRYAHRIVDGGWDPRLRRLETLWRDPETPTKAQTADAVVKLYGAKDGRGVPLLPREAAWEELGYTAERRRQLRAMAEAERDSAAQADPIAAAAAAFRTVPPGAEVTPEPGAAAGGAAGNTAAVSQLARTPAPPTT